MVSPANLDRIANAQETRGSKVFFRALRVMYLDLARRHEQGQELLVNTDPVKKAIQGFHIQVQTEAAEWQYNELAKSNRVKAMQMGMYERINQAVRTWVMLNTGASIKSISDTTLDIVKQMIASGQENGFGARKIAANIRAEAKGTFTAYRATVIARTEGTRAASHGHKLGAEQWEKVTGQKKWKAWSASADARTRDAHRSMLGSLPIPGDEDFIVDGSAMSAPGDPKGGAKNCVSCRCRAIYMSERIARQIRGEETPVVVPVEAVQVAPVESKPKPVAKLKPTRGTNVPKGLDKFKKETGLQEIDETIFDMLDAPVQLTFKEGGAHYAPNSKSVNLSYKFATGRSRDPWGAEAVIYHEYGHAIDDQRGLRYSPGVKNLMVKHRNILKINDGYANLHNRIMGDIMRSDDPVFRTQAVAAADTLMALNPKFGAGHSAKYMAGAGKKEAEFIAHAFENEFKGNPYFKKVAPELYTDMQDYVKGLK